jgi:hypothetical protein
VGEGDDALPTDDNSGTLRADGDSNMLSGGSDGNATTPVIGVIGGGAIGAICDGGSITIGDDDSVAIGNGGNLDADASRVGSTDSSLGAGDVLAAIGGGAIGTICGDGSITIGDGGSVAIGGGSNLDADDLLVGGADSSLGAGDVLAAISGGAIGAICGGDSVTIGGSSNLDADALRVGGDDNILGVGDLSTDDQCSSGGSGTLATGKGGNILRADDGIVLAVGWGILGTRSSGGPDHIAIHDLPTPRAFTIAAPPLCAHKEWSFALLPGCRSTFDLTHN